ncbi:MAG: ABC transporter substrate-binding protein [Oscillospiraceae bacterium]|nr:ABC transporter substrate-binding protein [Oscillospiraceae bacterium]
MKKFIAIMLVVCMALTLCACGSSSSSTTTTTDSSASTSDTSSAAADTSADNGSDDSAAATGDNVIRIGIYEAMTGDNGAGGKQEILGYDYANYLTPTVTVGGVEYTIEMVYADNGSTVDKAPSAAAEIVSQDVAVVLGSYGSSVCIAGGPTIGDAGVAAIAATSTNPQVTLGNDYYYRICFLDPFQGTVLANYAASELGATSVYCLGELGNEYDTGLISYFVQAFEELGGTVISDTFPTNTSDFSTYINKAITNDCDLIFCPVSVTYSTQILNMAGSMGADMIVLGGDTLDNNSVLASAVEGNVDLRITTFYQEGADEEFDEGFRAWLNEDSTRITNNGGNDIISATSVMGFDAYNTAIAAIQYADSVDPADIKAALADPDFSYTGVTGEIIFDENGDAQRDSAFVKMADAESGSWVLGAIQTVG